MNEVTIFDAVQVPESQLFCHPSRISNIYEPNVERVIQDSIFIPQQEVSISIDKLVLPNYRQIHRGGIKGRLGYAIECLSDGSVIDMGERLIYDARYIFNGNMAHLVQHHLSALGFIKNKLGLGGSDIVVLFEKTVSHMAKEVMDILGYEVLLTDLAVSCNSISVQVDKNNFFHLLPYVNNLEVNSWNEKTPEKIYVSRKHTRRITNELEIENYLRSEGYEKVYFEEESIINQWSMMRRATDVVAIHGAALGCLAFSSCTDKTRLTLVELFGPALVVNSFRKYLAILRGNWVGCRGRIRPEVVRDIDKPDKIKLHAFDDFEISVSTVEAAVQFVQNSSK